MLLQEFLVFIKNHIVLIIIWCVLLIIVMYILIVHTIIRCFEISCDIAISLINKKQAVVIDIRNSVDFFSGYIINSINIPYRYIKGYNNELNQFRRCPVVLVCNLNNVWSLLFVKIYLNKLGFLEVYVLKEGIYGWKDCGLPILSKKSKYLK